MEDMKLLLEHTRILQEQWESLLECKWTIDEYTDIVVLQAYRMILAELMDIFHLGSESAIKILSNLD
jgi:hypothetical protein